MREKINAAYELLMEKNTTFEKFEKVRILLKGVNPSIDKALASCSNEIKKLKKIQKGEVIELSVEILPEGTPEEKKKKKALLLLLSYWKNLRSEVKRVRQLYESEQSDKNTSNQKVNTIGKIVAKAKGPLGLVTVVAVGIVAVAAYLNSSAITIIIKNRGCSSLIPVVKLPVSIPGVELPTSSIPDNGQAIAKLPPLIVTVDGTTTGLVKITAFKFTMEYYLPSKNTEFLFDSQKLVGKRTTINLGQQKEHELIVQCPKS